MKGWWFLVPCTRSAMHQNWNRLGWWGFMDSGMLTQCPNNSNAVRICWNMLYIHLHADASPSAFRRIWHVAGKMQILNSSGPVSQDEQWMQDGMVWCGVGWNEGVDIWDIWDTWSFHFCHACASLFVLCVFAFPFRFYFSFFWCYCDCNIRLNKLSRWALLCILKGWICPIGL